MEKMLITGGSSGIGKACFLLFNDYYDITAPSRLELDLSNYESIANYDTSNFDIVINCAGVNKGTYLGFEHNTDVNQIEQITVNYIGPLLLAKNYIKKRDKGHFIYISSISIDEPELYNIVNASSKAALRFAFNKIDRSIKNIMFSVVCPGKTKTNMFYNNYCGTKSKKEVENEYNNSLYCTAEEVAVMVKLCIDKKIKQVKIVP
jgi:short-subunit dehydrogenase